MPRFVPRRPVRGSDTLLMAMSRTGKVLVWVLGGATAAAALVILWFVAMLSGGGGPKETDPDVVAAVTRVQEQNREELDLLMSRHVRPAMGGVSLARATGKECDPGQHNYKRDDSYHLLCTVSDGVLVTGSIAQLREQMLQLGRSLAGDPVWADERYWPISRVIRQYWDDKDRFPEGAPPGHLPTAQYDAREPGLRLSLDWIDGTEPGIRLNSFSGPTHWSDAAGAMTSSEAILAALSAPGRYGLLVEVERTAFRA